MGGGARSPAAGKRLRLAGRETKAKVLFKVVIHVVTTGDAATLMQVFDVRQGGAAKVLAFGGPHHPEHHTDVRGERQPTQHAPRGDDGPAHGERRHGA